MKSEVENIAKNKKNWRPIYEVIGTSFLHKQKNHQSIYTSVKDIQTNLSSYHLGSK